MKILLVDDSKTMRNIQKTVLSKLPGCEFAEACDGVAAMAVLAGQQFDLILVDWNMPNMDGLTLVKTIRQTDKKTLLLMVTTEAEKSRVIDAIKAGVSGYVAKPFTPDSLLEKVQQMLAKAAA